MERDPVAVLPGMQDDAAGLKGPAKGRTVLRLEALAHLLAI